MNRTLSSATAFALLLSFATFDAQAFPLVPAPSGTGAPDVTLVEAGCGPGWHRNEFGRCRPSGPAIVGAPPVVVAPAPEVLVCGGGFRWHPYRRRCVPI